MRIRFIYIIFIFILSSTPDVGYTLSSTTINTSLLNLITSPNEYNNKEIIVEGYLCIDDIGSGIYISRESCVDKVSGLGIGIEVTQNYLDMREKFGHLSKIHVRGHFVSKEKNTIALDMLDYEGIIKNPNINKYGVKWEVDGYVDDDIAKDINKIIDQWILAIKKHEYNNLARMMDVSDDEKIKKNGRMKWLIFDSPLSIYNQFTSNNINHHILKLVKNEIYENRGYAACLTKGTVSDIEIFNIPPPGKYSNLSCFYVYKKGDEAQRYIIDPVSFGLY